MCFPINHFTDIGGYVIMNNFSLFNKLIGRPVTEIPVSRSQVLVHCSVLVFSLVTGVNRDAFIAVKNLYLRWEVEDFNFLPNLDRQLGATKRDIGRLKIDVVERQLKKSSTAKKINVSKVPHSLAEESGYRSALNCDVQFSCVDRPLPRHILNHIAYSHLIPVIDGGIRVVFEDNKFFSADWQFQTVSPSKPCLQCLEALQYLWCRFGEKRTAW